MSQKSVREYVKAYLVELNKEELTGIRKVLGKLSENDHKRFGLTDQESVSMSRLYDFIAELFDYDRP